ncbi:MAG: peptidase M50, partial [Pirellulaceae bacterium]|nr:peptidase M50 [Pirellulaceae bacterium]
MRILLDPQVVFSSRDYGGQTSYVAHHPGLGKFYRIGIEEYRVAIRLDGEQSIEAITQAINAEGLQWSPQDVATFAAVLVKQRLASAKASPTMEAVTSGVTAQVDVETPRADHADLAKSIVPTPSSSQHPVTEQPTTATTTATDDPSTSRTWFQHLPKYLSLVVSQRIPLVQGGPIAAKWQGIIGPAFSIPGMILWAVLVASGMLVVYGHFDSFVHELHRLFDPGMWPVLIGFWCIAKVIHEMGHAVCASRYGVRIGKMGVMFFLLAPLAYVDVTDAWKIRNRLKRVHIALAGVYLELGIAAIAAWAWWWLPAGLMKHLAAQVFVVTGPTTLLVNANPLLRLDGYYVLSDLLEIPNLRMHGRAQLGRRLEWMMFGIPIKPSLLSGWRRPTATVHAICAVVFQFFWMSGLIIAASMWARGLGVILAGAALLLWGIVPLSRWVYKIWT